MANSHETPTLPPATLASIIDTARDAGTPRKAFAIAADASEEMVRRWELGQLPKLRPFKRLISRHNLLPDLVRQQMVDWLLRGTGWRAVPCDASDCATLDVNGDGRVDGHDTLRMNIEAVGEAGKVIDLLADAVADNGCLTEQEKAEVRPVLYSLRDSVQRAIETLDYSKGLRVARS